MLSPSQSDFKYDDQTPPSNPRRPPPTGDSSFGRGDRYRNIFSRVFGFRGGSSSGSPNDNRGSSRNDDKRRNHNSILPATRERNERSHSYTKPLSRDDLRDFALSTLQAFDDGEYFPPGAVEPYDLKMKIMWTEENTRYYGPEAGEGGEILESEFVRINEKGVPPDNSATVDTAICIGQYSTLVGARKVHLALASNPNPLPNKKIGVLNFASAKKPGGEFIDGSQGQEESIARASTLYPSLLASDAYQFYTHYREDPSNAYYTHAMVYSPCVVLLRDDDREWRSPVEVDVLTCAAVNAGEIRRQLEREERLRKDREVTKIYKRAEETELEKALKKERMRREVEKVKREMKLLRMEARLKKEKEELKKAELMKLQKGVVKSEDGSETKGTEKGKEKEKDSGRERESTSIEQKAVKKWKGKEKEKGDETEPKENPADSPEKGSGLDGEMMKRAGVPLKISQEFSSSGTSSRSLSPQTQPSQAPKRYRILTYADAESQIQDTMYTRISRILHLFQLHQIPHLILGSFGTDVYQNHIDIVASIFADLLIKPGGRFKNVFKTVVFAILGKETMGVFENVFSTVEKQAQRETGGTGGTHLFVDEDKGDEGVREEEEDRMRRRMRWEARRTALGDEAAQADAEADAASADQASTAAYSAAQAKVDATQVDTAHAGTASQPKLTQKMKKSVFRLSRQSIAQGTIKAINNGYIEFADAASNMCPTRHNLRLSADDTVRGTEYFRQESNRLKHWQQGPPPAATEHHRPRAAVEVVKMSTLQGARFLSEKYPASRIGVLNFASATKPGGGFINGASGQEDSIARSSTLFLSLQTPKARPFYELHDQDNKRGYYSHGMIYSPSVAIFRDDDGQWLRPYHVDIVSSPAVNAGLVRKLRHSGKSETEDKILAVMKERMGRILALFELSGTRNLILGSFGTGVFQNDVSSLAKIWGELLVAPEARFAHSFDNVVFAIPDGYTLQKFHVGIKAGISPPAWFFSDYDTEYL